MLMLVLVLKCRLERNKTLYFRANPTRTQPLCTLHKTGSCPHLVFLDASLLPNALSPSTLTRPLPWPSSEEPCRLSHYLSKYDAERPSLDAVRAHADSYMGRFEFDLALGDQAINYRTEARLS
jgi:ribosomal RNA-processing protein 7